MFCIGNVGDTRLREWIQFCERLNNGGVPGTVCLVSVTDRSEKRYLKLVANQTTHDLDKVTPSVFAVAVADAGN